MNEIPIAQLIDHALLHPTLTDAEILNGCDLAARLHVASVCVKPYAVGLAVRALQGSEVAVGTVIGFPHGSQATPVKAFEAEQACADGAVELDMVVNVGKVLQGDWEFVEQDIRAVLGVARRSQAVLKVIFETDHVTEDADKTRLCQLCGDLGVDFVKTSTGFGFVKMPEGSYGYVGATEHDITLMREACPSRVGVKASGGIRSRDDAERMRSLGASRLGTSSSEAIVGGKGNGQAGY